jgi:hypothetical protein
MEVPRKQVHEIILTKLLMIPRPTLEQSVVALSDRDEYKTILGFIRDERDRFFSDMRQAATSDDVMKLAGSIATCDEILQVLTPEKK